MGCSVVWFLNQTSRKLNILTKKINFFNFVSSTLQAAMGEGRTVVEKQSKSKAVEEIREISKQILSELN